MNGMFTSLADWFAARSLQEQKILRWGVLLIGLLMLYLVMLQPVLSAWSGRQALLQQRLDELSWLRAQASLVEQLNSSCDARHQPLQIERVETDMTALAQRLGLQAQVRRIAGEDRWLILLNDAQGNRVLGYARSLVCAGLEVNRLEFSLNGAADERGTAELEAGIPGL